MPQLSAARVTIVAGKGGVGKTTVTAVLARAAADAGLRVLAVELDGKPVLADLVGDVPCDAIAGRDALEAYLREHGFGRVARRLSTSGVIDVVATAAPGIDDIVVLGRIKQLERSGEWDVIVVDGPAAGHAITFLTSAGGLLDAVRGGPVRAQAQDVVDLLDDPERCQVVLVTLPETTPVNELVETAYALEDRVGVRLGPIIVNNIDGLGDEDVPDPHTADLDGSAAADLLREAAVFRRARLDMQRVEIARLGTELALEQWHLPMLPVAGLDAADVAGLAGALRRGAPVSAARRRRVTRASPARWRGVRVSLDAAVAGAAVIVCCGSGGVGKTTTAAVIGLHAARAGQRAVVVTIDPARRLADALGLAEGLAAEPQRIELDAAGELWAMMLDTATAFDGIVRRNAPDEAQAERILSNRFYRNISGALSGTQEYMAAETLHQLHGDERFDVVVVDTPPSRNALDFLEAPSVLARFLDHRLFKLLMLPARRGMKVVNAATQPLLRAIGRVVGTDVLADAVAFFQAFAGMEGGFRTRAEEVIALLGSADTRYVIVASPHRDTVTEAVWFAERIAEHGITRVAGVANRVHPTFGEGTAEEAQVAARDAVGDVAALWRNVAALRALAEAARAELAPFAALLGEGPLTTVPLLSGDVHDLAGLDEISGHLFSAP